MNSASNNDEGQDKGWLSAFLLVFGLGLVGIAVLTLLGGSVLPGLVAAVMAVLFFALRQILDQQRAAARRLQQIESELAARRGNGAGPD